MQRADEERANAEKLRVELIDLRVSERIDALAAQRRAADELKGLQAAGRTMRRLRWALRGR